MMGVAGMIPPKEDYLKFLREITMQYDILLIFDEVMTARLSLGGGQEFFEVTPDLSCFGKMIGGYFPIGAFGGREDVMNLFSPERENFIPHSGTFNGNAIAMVAGIACMESLTSSAIEKINSLGNYLKKSIEKVFEEENIVGQVTGAGSLYNIHFTPVEVVDYRSAETSSGEVKTLLHMALINKGIFIARRSMFNLSTVMTEKEVDAFIGALRECVPVLKNALRADKGSLQVSRSYRSPPFKRIEHLILNERILDFIYYRQPAK
jgi:glutamate-1-semialdehyde 2,1-aminomutase